MTPGVECLYSAHRETWSSSQETSRNRGKPRKWQIFRAYNRAGSNVCEAALEQHPSPAWMNSAWMNHQSSQSSCPYDEDSVNAQKDRFRDCPAEQNAFFLYCVAVDLTSLTRTLSLLQWKCRFLTSGQPGRWPPCWVVSQGPHHVDLLIWLELCILQYPS